MNENVTNKTPKRRRWIVRLLVSALCVLLASSLLFVGVVADTITLTAQFNGTYSLASLPEGSFVYPLDSSHFVYRTDYMLYINSGSETLSTFDLRSSSGYDSSYSYAANRTKFFYDGKDLYCFGFYSSGSTHYISLFIVSLDEFRFVSSSAINFSRNDSLNMGNYGRSLSFTVSDGVVYGFLFSKSSTSSTATVKVNPFYLKISSQRLYLFTSFTTNNSVSSTEKYDVFYKNGWIVSSLGLARFNVSSSSNVAGTRDEIYNFFEYEGDIYAVNSDSLKKWDADTLSFETVGNGVEGTSFYAENGVLTAFKTTSSYTVSYTVYSGLPTTEPPPESSDETTEEPPPESSEDSSDEPVEGGTKIWGSILNTEGSYTSTLLGTLDLSQATEVRAYIGSWTSKDSSYQSETPVPLTFYVYNGEEGPPDIYTFDYHAAGYSLLGDSVSDFTFPDVIGQFFALPYNGETDLYFANVAPYGTVLVSTPFGDSFGGRVMLNLVSSDSYFRLDFVDEDTFAVALFNSDGPGSRTNFEMDIRAYREGYRLEDGETTSSRWFYPSFGSSVSYTAQYVTENGLYLVFVDSVNDTVYPWEDGTWSDIIGDANSRLEDISADHALLESMANDAYGQYSFDPMTNQNFVGAVSQFNDIRDSSGGDYILRYMWGMWNIHPFASSMIAIVGTLAIVGFIIRKM